MPKKTKRADEANANAESELDREDFIGFWGREGHSDAPHISASIRVLKLVRFLRMGWGFSAGGVDRLVAVANFYIDHEQDLSIAERWTVLPDVEYHDEDEDEEAGPRGTRAEDEAGEAKAKFAKRVRDAMRPRPNGERS